MIPIPRVVSAVLLVLVGSGPVQQPMLIRRMPKLPSCTTLLAKIRQCRRTGAMPLLSNTAANAFCSTPETTRTFLRRTRRQRESISLNWISWSCRTAMGITWGIHLPLKCESQSAHLCTEGRVLSTVRTCSAAFIAKTHPFHRSSATTTVGRQKSCALARLGRAPISNLFPSPGERKRSEAM